MDRERFDALTRLYASRVPRRSALAALLGAALLSRDPMPLLAGHRQDNDKGKGKGKRKKQGRNATVVVCHNGETFPVPREAVQGIQLAGGFVGACPPGAGASPCVALGNICDATTLFGGDPCCQYQTSSPAGVGCFFTAVPGVGSCQKPCTTTAECVAAIGSPDLECIQGANCFGFPFTKCCFRKHTENPASCASGIACRLGNSEDRGFECCLPGETCDFLLGCV